MEDFAAVWADIQNRLRPRSLPTWSRENGEMRKFEIVGVAPEAISILPAEGLERPVRKSDFANVYAHWPDYISENISRKTLEERSRSRNTSYIFGLLHWRETVAAD